MSPKKVSIWLILGLVLFATIGFSDATYIAFKHMKGQIPPCSILDGCGTVLTSKYASLGPIRLEWLGILYYFSVIALSILYLDRKSEKVAILVSKLTILGFAASIILMTIQVFIIKSYCLYCVMSALSSTALFVLGMLIYAKIKRNVATN